MLRAAKSVFLLVAVACLAWFAWQSRDLLTDILRSARPAYLLLAVALWLLMNGFAALFSAQIFRARGTAVSIAIAARIHISNLPARYIPGGIWHTVGRAASFRNLDISARDIAIFVFLENVLAVSVAFLIGGTLLFVTRASDTWRDIALLSAIVAAALLVLSPLLLARIERFGAVRFPVGPFVTLTLLTGLSWCVAAGAFVTYLMAFPDIGAAIAPLEVAGSYLFSWGVGFVSIFAPQGIGIFEVVAADLLRGNEPLIGIAALLAGFRLVILVADTVAWTALHLMSGLTVGQGRDLLGDKADQEDDH
jgi:hypothetical protein